MHMHAGFARFSLSSSMASAFAMVAALAWRMHRHIAAGALEQAGVRRQSSGADASASIVLNGSGAGPAKGAKGGFGGMFRTRADKGRAVGAAEPADGTIKGVSGKGGLREWGATPVVAAAAAVILLLMVASAYPGQLLTCCES